MSRLEKKHPLAIRWLHWISFPMLSLMIWSGLMIYWANDVYRIGWSDVTLFHFFPDPLLPALNLDQRLAEGMAFHFFFMWLFALNGILYVLYLLISGEWRYVVPAEVLRRCHSSNVSRSSFEEGLSSAEQI